MRLFWVTLPPSESRKDVGTGHLNENLLRRVGICAVFSKNTAAHLRPEVLHKRTSIGNLSLQGGLPRVRSLYRPGSLAGSDPHIPFSPLRLQGTFFPLE